MDYLGSSECGLRRTQSKRLVDMRIMRYGKDKYLCRVLDKIHY
jgi:hypothetical protein